MSFLNKFSYNRLLIVKNKMYSFFWMKQDPDMNTSLSVTCGAAVGWSEAGQAVWPVQRGGAIERRRTAKGGGRQGGGGRGGRGQGAPVFLEDNKKDTRVT